MPPAARARSDAYFEGKYWLMLCDFLWLLAVMLILLNTGASARIRDLAQRLTQMRWLQSWIYWVGFSILAALLRLPLDMYENFIRERQYGLMNQTFAGWFWDELVAFCVIGLLIGGLSFMVLMAVVRRLPRTWHLWGIAVSTLIVVFGIVIAPVFIAPLFNTYKPLQNQRIKNQILAMARANDIDVSDVFEVNASKQSNRVSAFVTGLGNTERIVLNDNLLNRVSPQGIMAVMGHEMGHYVMHHIFIDVLFFTIVCALMFLVLRWALEWSLRRWGVRWRVRGVADVAGLPLALIILATLNFLATPFENTFSRTQEFEADLYGLNASRQPDGEAEVDVLLGEYRKLDPGTLEEFVFFDHPSGRTRIRAAMQWKAENLCLFDRTLPCGSRATATDSDF
jgi:STE24 endopeptidase